VAARVNRNFSTTSDNLPVSLWTAPLKESIEEYYAAKRISRQWRLYQKRQDVMKEYDTDCDTTHCRLCNKICGLTFADEPLLDEGDLPLDEDEADQEIDECTDCREEATLLARKPPEESVLIRADVARYMQLLKALK